MDDSGGLKESRERPYSRVPSRATTPTIASTHMTPKSASGSSHVRESSHTGSHPIHKHHHSQCGRSVGSTRATSREPSDELRKSIASASSLLQERLQQERNERRMSRQGVDLSASVVDVRDRGVHDSPVRSATATGRRQMPDSDFGDELIKNAGMGARQMEQVGSVHDNARSPEKLTGADLDAKTLSKLHKQNFDLKLELFYRREKQMNLEERVEKLESQYGKIMDANSKLQSQYQELETRYREAMEINDNMLVEMEQKDKAIGDAVGVIVTMEAHIDELVRQRDMVRQVEADGSYRHSPSDGSNPESVTTDSPKQTNLGVPHLTEDIKSLARMPSFLSDHSQQTENLRNAVLKARNSGMHLRRVSGSSADPSEINRIASPSLSILSESSFPSIYGFKDAQDKSVLQPSGSVAAMDGSHVDRSPTPTNNANRQSWVNGQIPPVNYGGGARLPTQMQSLNNVLDTNSPLQKIERLEGHMAVVDNVLQQPISDRSRDTSTPTSAKPPINNSTHQSKSKQEKREALQKVLTNYPTHRDFSNPQAFPPTPDTVSSSTLRQHQNFTSSQDSLTRQTGTVPVGGLLPVYDRIAAARESTYHMSLNQHVPTTTISSRTQMPMPAINPNPLYDVGQLARSIPSRTRSASDTASSRARADSVGSDSDSDGGADARSETASVDYWMRESMKPNRYQTGISTQRENGGSTSPDLFSFPAEGGGWETDVIFGALKGSGYLGSPVSALKRDPLDEMASSLQTSQTEVLEPPMMGTAPPTPDRRSSLHARTGSTNVVYPSGGKLRKSLAKGQGMGWMDGRGRSNSVDTVARGSFSKAQTQQPGSTTPGKRNQYPPISGQASKGRGLGLNSLFRRSGSESSSVPPSATEATFPVPTPAQLSALSHTMALANLPLGRNSVPPPATMPWRPPGVVEDDLKSATPPPIMRSRGQSLLSGTSGVRITDATTPQLQGAEMVTPTTPITVVPAQGGSVNATPNVTGRRKWLGLGRMGSMKNKMG
ncbi:hypothetical protein K449DRAFT_426937 [Hypoxylon sp. EC38]|nr:hypothetical protein K449DRAFT_426937 [Hypoxylon sp. EC38]